MNCNKIKIGRIKLTKSKNLQNFTKSKIAKTTLSRIAPKVKFFLILEARQALFNKNKHLFRPQYSLIFT